jgi:hypothetical protein
MYELEVTTRSGLAWFARISRFAFLTEGGLSAASPLKAARTSLSTLSSFSACARLTAKEIRIVESCRYILRVDDNYFASVTTLAPVPTITSVAAVAARPSLSRSMLISTLLASLSPIATGSAFTPVLAILAVLSLATHHEEVYKSINCVYINIESTGHRSRLTTHAVLTVLSFHTFTT